MENNQQYLSVENLATHLSCTPQYVRLLIKQKKLPAQQVGKTWIINASVLEDKNFIFEYCKEVPDQVRKNKTIPKYTVLSFFSGAMGLDYG